MDIIYKIGIPGWTILAIQFLFFAVVIKLGLTVEKSSRSLRSLLSRCLRESRDLVQDGNHDVTLARDCATRYRLAASRIEDVDAYAIANSEISRSTATQLLKRSLSFAKIDELLHGGSGFLVTLGLIGTFFGLMANMVQLSELVMVSDGGGAQQDTLMQGLAAVFPSMAAAFTTSLVGVLLSSILWIIGTANGMLGLKDEIAELLAGYLEQVVQADCRRYSLVGESMERMEKYLTDYLSTFSKRVGDAIELAIMKNITSLISSLNDQVDQVASFVTQVKDGSAKMSEAGDLYFRASKILNESDFAEKFGESCESYLQGSEEFRESSQLLLQASNDAASSCRKLAESVSDSIAVTESLGTTLTEAKENTVQVLSLGIKSIENMKEATSAMESIQKRGMTWLSMRAKTDQQLIEINSQLNDVIKNIASVAMQVANTRVSDISEIQQNISSINQIVFDLSTVARQQEQATKSIIQGLQEMTSVADRVAALEQQQESRLPST
jgi:hypothetical protein